MRRTAGFTILELLVASAVALALLALVGQTLMLDFRIDQRTSLSIPVQQSTRAALEVMAQDLRSAVGPRVVYSGMTAGSLTTSTGTVVTMLVPVANTTFSVNQPALSGTGAFVSLLPSSTTRLVNATSLANSAGTTQSCATALTNASWALLYSSNNAQAAGTTRAVDASQLRQVSGCTVAGSVGTVTFTSTVPATTWNPNTYVVSVQPVTYFVQDNTLYRQIDGQTAQVVIYDVAQLTLSYVPEVGTGSTGCTTDVASSAPTCPPRTVNVTLTVQPQGTGTGVSSLTATQSVYMR